jgi:peptidoglycan/xylan/chitin deacetylase (PgdA/CDA1 family)
MVCFKVFKLHFKFIIIILILLTVISPFFVYTNVKADEEPYVEVPIIMYHSVLKSRSGDYIIHPDVLEKDLLYIQEKGYTTITISDLIDYVYNNTPLPQKPIIITFDDGHYNNLGYAVPILKKYNMKAVISIIGKYTDDFSKTDEANLNYGHLRWKDIIELINDGTIEFQNHTYNLHTINSRKGAAKKSNESLEEYASLLSTDILKLQEEFKNNANYTPTAFTYPYGAISKESIPIIKQLGFKASLSCLAGVNHITKNPDCLYGLKRNNRPSGISTENFFKKILK